MSAHLPSLNDIEAAAEVVYRAFGPTPQQPNVMRVTSSGKPAETAYEVVERWHRLSLLHQLGQIFHGS